MQLFILELFSDPMTRFFALASLGVTVSPGHCHCHMVEATSHVPCPIHTLISDFHVHATGHPVKIRLWVWWVWSRTQESAFLTSLRWHWCSWSTDHTSRGKDPYWFPHQTHIRSITTLRPGCSGLAPSQLWVPFYLLHHMKEFNDNAVVQICLEYIWRVYRF